MGFNLTGKHLIAGEWVAGDATFSSKPAFGKVHDFAVGTPKHVDTACNAAEEAFCSYGYSTREERCKFLNTIADQIESLGEQITEIGTQETGLPRARLEGERGRTTGQLRLFASYILEKDYLDIRHDELLPERKPLPRPDLRMIQRPFGPVAIFGASNFPLAFSVAGGDTASALAAGCSVVVKGHPAHPGTGEIIAQAVFAAIKACNLNRGVFSLIQSNDEEVGQALVQHPLITAVGFTGSLKGGSMLYKICAQRPTPIPFYGEFGSINPLFLLPKAMESRAADIGTGWAASLTMGAGQFCTNPGIAYVIDGAAINALITAAKKSLANTDRQIMLTDGIAETYQRSANRVTGLTGVTEIMGKSGGFRHAGPYLFETTGETWLATEELREEVFGPLGIVVRVTDTEQMLKIAKSLGGQLTCSLHMDDDDTVLANKLIPILERKAGRILANGYPTGVEVCHSMVHGGPYPASTNFGATSVGTLSIRRFLRPICYQNIPEKFLPKELQSNPKNPANSV